MTSVKFISLLLIALMITGCITSQVEGVRQGKTGLEEGEAVVIIAKSYHLGNETEKSFIECLTKSVGREGIRIIPSEEFVDLLFPWFEPRTAPANTKDLPELMKRPRVTEIIRENKIRYIVWIDGDTEKVGGGGSLSCAAGPAGGGCFGFAWWQKDGKYEADVWDLTGLEDVGRVSTEVKGTSYMPAIVIPIPLIARTQSRACKGLGTELSLFLLGEEE